MFRARHIAPLIAIFASTPAEAHLGHVGEVAGHSHWIGLAAAGAAAAIAVAVSVLGKKKDAEKKVEDAEREPEQEGEKTPAGA